MKNKSAAIAALLNIVPGVGYLYLGRRRTLAVLLIVGMVLGDLSVFDPAFMAFADKASINFWDLLGLIGFVGVEVAFIYDAYKEAKLNDLSKQIDAKTANF